MKHTLNIEEFRAIFPAFSDDQAYPDAQIEMYWSVALSYFGAEDGPLFSGPPLQTALNLMTAHLMFLMNEAAAPSSGKAGPVTGMSVDKVSVQFAAPPFKDGWQYWLSQSPYGQQLWALLKVKSSGGFYFGGKPEQRAFRKIGGFF